MAASILLSQLGLKCYPRRLPCLAGMEGRGHRLLISLALGDASHPRFGFVSLPGPETLKTLVDAVGEEVWINEIVTWRPTSTPPRFYVDVDYKRAEQDPKFDEYLTIIAARVFAVAAEMAGAPVRNQRVIHVTNSRPIPNPKEAGDAYKHSAHLIFPGVTTHTNGVAREVASRVRAALEATGAVPGGIVDLAVYNPFQAMRVAGSSKAMGQPPARVEGGEFLDSLITTEGVDAVHLTLPSRTAPSVPRKRKNVKVESCPVDENNPVVANLYKVFKQPIGCALGWQDLIVVDVQVYESEYVCGVPDRSVPKMFIFRVTHAGAKVGHYCAARERHNGAANRTFLIRARPIGAAYILQTACFMNNRALRCLELDPIRNPGQKPRDGKNLGPWWTLHAPPRDPSKSDEWGKSPLQVHL